MARIVSQINSFVAGKLDPLLLGRWDLKSYYAGALEFTNVMPSQLGSCFRRPGL